MPTCRCGNPGFGLPRNPPENSQTPDSLHTASLAPSSRSSSVPCHALPEGDSLWAGLGGPTCPGCHYVPSSPGLPQWLSSIESAYSAGAAGDAGSIPGEDPLERGMATYSSILAWRILWTDEPGGLQKVANGEAKSRT